MTQLAIGASRTVTVGDMGTVTVATNGGFFSYSGTTGLGVAFSRNYGPDPIRHVIGPFKEGGTLTIVNSSVNYMDVDATVDVAALQTLVSGASNRAMSISRVDGAAGSVILPTLAYQVRVSHLEMPFDPNRYVAFSSGKAWFGDFYKNNTGDKLLTGRIKVRAGIEYPAGVYTPLYAADGSRDLIVTPAAPIGYLAWTGVSYTPGTALPVLHVRAEQLDALSTTNTVPLKYFRSGSLKAINYDDSALGDSTAMGDYTLNSSQPNSGSGSQLPSNSLGGAMGPIAITSLSASAPLKFAGIIGDSIYSDPQQPYKMNRGCSATRGAKKAGFTALQYGEPTARLDQNLASGGLQQRINLCAAAGCTDFVLGYLTNDHSNGIALATMQANVLSAVALIVAAGMVPYVPTTPPRTTSSTDNYATGIAANQTVYTTVGTNYVGGSASIWGQMNDWIRSQAALGYWKLIEFADAVTVDRNVCAWKGANRTVSDGAITSATSNLSSATAAWTNADVGRMVIIPGAGAASATLTAYIKTITSATVVVIAGQDGAALTASTTVSGQTLVIGPMTQDGTHPSDTGDIEFGSTAFATAFATA